LSGKPEGNELIERPNREQENAAHGAAKMCVNPYRTNVENRVSS